MSKSQDRPSVVLVIDDSPSILGFITLYLEDKAFEVISARDGEEGITKAGQCQPDLILLDVMMPGIDGFETCVRLKRDPLTRMIPVLFMTTMGSVQNKLEGFKAGGVDYIVKPFDGQELVARIDTHLTIGKLHRELEEQNRHLQQALDDIKKLQGIIPICSGCKKIRDDKGYWNQIETYIQEHSETEFSHSLCEECARRLYPDLNVSSD